MHFFKNSVSFIAIMCVCGATVAATTGRVGVTGVTGAASRRLPSLSNIVKSSVSSSSTTSSSSSTLLSDSECIDDYRDCMKSENACGSDFEECTTNVLFHGHMGECFSTLYQCSSTALTSLMGTSSLSALSNVSSYVDDTNNTEVARYTYPTDGSIMGIDIIGAATRNKLSTSDCVKKYKRCLNKDDVCGEDFELCTSESEFKKQGAMCDSVLSRCQKEGFQQLFGEAKTVKPVGRNFKPDADGAITQWIADGATLAASNAVNTCYKVVDNCFASACAKNPYSCVEDTDWTVVNAAESIVENGISTSTDNSGKTGKQMATDVRKFFRSACTDTIGANQYCFMTFNDGKKPTKADLQDEDLREEVFGDAYDARKTILTTKVNELVKKFDETARNKCIETFKTCAVRSCGGGSGAACYSRVFGNSATQKSINGSVVYDDIKNGCEAAVNTDANCMYMAAMQDDSNTYTFEIGGTTTSFGVLFPTYTNGNSDSQIVAALNADLSTAYNDVAIAQMKKQCQNVVANCVKSMCGTDYQNCFRNRNDVSVNTYTSDNTKFNKSMNKVGGVLDYTIVQGLCASTVKNSDTCAESLAIAKMGISDGDSDVGSTWGSNSSISNAWRTSAQNGYSTDTVADTDDLGRQLCTCSNGNKDVCDFEDGGVSGCSTQVMVSRDVLIDKTAVNNVFQDVLADVEAEAQAIYKAKLTKEQNVCLAQNSGANPNATFVWAKLKGKMSSDYSVNGLGESGSVESNDLYGSFCRVKVTLQSEDHDVQTLLSGGSVNYTNFDDDKLKAGEKGTLTGVSNANAYFATGDAFTCGSWLSADNLEKITTLVGSKAREEAGQGSAKDKSTRIWATLGSAVAGGVIGGVVYDKIQTSDKWGGLLNKNLAKSKSSSNCGNLVSQARSKYQEALSDSLSDNATEEQKEKAKQTKQSAMNTARTLALQAQSQSEYSSSNVPSITIKSDGSWDKDQLKKFSDALDDIESACQSDMEDAKTAESQGQKQRSWTDATVGLASAGVTAGLAYGITASVQKSKYETAESDAVKEWMENIGSKIHCYIGGQLVGDYGDIVTVSVTDEDE